jgi:hypothetical protein
MEKEATNEDTLRAYLFARLLDQEMMDVDWQKEADQSIEKASK